MVILESLDLHFGPGNSGLGMEISGPESSISGSKVQAQDPAIPKCPIDGPPKTGTPVGLGPVCKIAMKFVSVFFLQALHLSMLSSRYKWVLPDMVSRDTCSNVVHRLYRMGGTFIFFLFFILIFRQLIHNVQPCSKARTGRLSHDSCHLHAIKGGGTANVLVLLHYTIHLSITNTSNCHYPIQFFHHRLRVNIVVSEQKSRPESI